jgi:hypothetical protein
MYFSSLENMPSPSLSCQLTICVMKLPAHAIRERPDVL